MRRHWERIRATGARGAARYYLGTVLLERAGIEIDWVYRAPARMNAVQTSRPVAFDVITSFSQLTDVDLANLEAYGGTLLLEQFRANLASGEACAVQRVDGQLAGVGWVSRLKAHDAIGAQPCWIVWKGFTRPEFRGLGVQSARMVSICEWVRRHPGEEASWPIFTECSVNNESSNRGIQRSGFQKVGRKYKLSHWTRYRALQASHLLPERSTGTSSHPGREKSEASRPGRTPMTGDRHRAVRRGG